MYYFVGVNKTIEMSKNAAKEIDDIVFSRYACYLIAQNGDPRGGRNVSRTVNFYNSTTFKIKYFAIYILSAPTNQ